MALPGRDRPVATAETHFVSGRPLKAVAPEGYAVATFALGCFWGAERLFWQLPGVYLTTVGYTGGFTQNPTYEEVCSGHTGHAEAVEVTFDPKAISYADLVRLFFESHDPTQGMRQGNDVGTQYRSAIYVHDEAQRAVAEAAREAYGQALAKAGKTAAITTTIEPAGPYYFAEAYHQQYLAKNPAGYCGLGGTGVSCPIPGAGVLS
jgi:peptide-methionine (S)-S-oxide reductase